MKYLVTGATGLLGNNIVRLLLAEGAMVRAMARATSDKRPLEGLAVDVREGELAQPEALAAACQGVDCVIHSAGHVHIGWSQAEQHQRVNVEGTRNVAAAARATGARLVHISSVNALGLGALKSPASEGTSLPGIIACPYVTTKRQAEQIVLAEMERGLSGVIVNPGFMLGPWDWKPSSGKMLLEVAKYVPFAPTGAFSVADARDVAAAAIAAAKSPAANGRYVLGGHNITYFDAWKQFAEIAGARPPWGRPGPINRWIGGLAGDFWGRVTGQEPNLNTAAMRLSCQEHCFSSVRAEKELGYRIRPLAETIEAAWKWFVEHGYVARQRSSS